MILKKGLEVETGTAEQPRANEVNKSFIIWPEVSELVICFVFLFSCQDCKIC